jgi:hypothetical protein
MDAVVFLVFCWALLGAIGAAIGQSRGRPLAGFLWGCCLGPLGWLIIGCGPNLTPRQQCPACLGWVPPGAVKCLHCAEPLPPPAATASAARCPVCGATNLCSQAERTHGLRCRRCQAGYVPDA